MLLSPSPFLKQFQKGNKEGFVGERENWSEGELRTRASALTKLKFQSGLENSLIQLFVLIALLGGQSLQVHPSS